MKKRVLGFAFLSMLFLMTGCGEQTNNIDGDIKSVADVQINNSCEVIPQSYEILTDRNTYVPATENQEFNEKTDHHFFNISRANATGMGSMETKNAIYIFKEANNGSVLKVFDKNTKTLQMYCNKPECDHTVVECNGFFEKIMCGFIYKDEMYLLLEERTYGTAEGKDTVEINMYKLEQQERKFVRNILTTMVVNNTENSVSCFLAIQHRGYLYYVYDIGTGGLKETFYNNGSNSIYRISLETEGQVECVANLERGGEMQMVNMQGSGSYVYYMLPDETGMGKCYRFNVENKKSELLELGEIATENFLVWNGNVYYKKDWTSTQIYKFDPNTGDEKVFVDTVISGYEVSSDIFADRESLIVYCYSGEVGANNVYCFTVFDKEGKNIGEYVNVAPYTGTLGGDEFFISIAEDFDSEEVPTGDVKIENQRWTVFYADKSILAKDGYVLTMKEVK